MVYRIALNCLRNPADAEDAAQTAMLRLWRSGQAFPDDNQLRHWLVRVTVMPARMPCGSPCGGPAEWCLWTTAREPVFNTPEHQNLYAEVMAPTGQVPLAAVSLLL